MKLISIKLLNYRNYDSLNLLFNSRLIFITGSNAFGKTNLLEAISYLSIGRSFRGVVDKDLIKSDQSDTFISCKFIKSETQYKIDIGLTKNNTKLIKKIKINNKTVTGRSELIGKLITIVMSPDDLLIVEGGPTYRRKFIDIVLSYQKSGYLNDLIKYNKLLKQRNSVLKNIKSKKSNIQDLKYWDKEFIELANRIISQRIEFIEKFENILIYILKSISNNRDQVSLKIKYTNDLETSNFQEALNNSNQADVWKGYTSVGPHRHNLIFNLNNYSIESYGSQGQKRSLVLALRIAQFYFLRDSLGYSPILLIDDVIRELDKNRRNAFIKLLADCGQAIFTTPDMDGIELMNIKEKYDIISVSEPGKINLQK